MLKVTLVRSKDKSVLVRDEAGAEAWLARSLIKIEDSALATQITLPTWLAIEKGLRAASSAGQKTLF